MSSASMNSIFNDNVDDEYDSLENEIVNSNIFKLNDCKQQSTCCSLDKASVASSSNYNVILNNDFDGCFEKVQQEVKIDTNSKQASQDNSSILNETNVNNPLKMASIKIRIEDCNNICSTSGTTTNSHDDKIFIQDDYDFNVVDQINRKLEPTFPGHIAPLIGSALDVRQLENLNNNMNDADSKKKSTTDVKNKHNNYNRLTTFSSGNNFLTGSLSDNTCERSTFNNKDISFERKQMVDRLKNWKKSHKIITHIRENPFNMHLECLERLSKETGVDTTDLSIDSLQQSTKQQQPLETTTLAPEPDNSTIKDFNTQEPSLIDNNQQQRLQTYAAHLTHLYKRNQSLMDNNSDFRSLLYNIICCLLIQDEQILSTVSVTKMIDVIRTHLDSTSKFYSSSMTSVTNLDVNNQQLSNNKNFNNLPTSTIIQQQGSNQVVRTDRRKSSLGSSSFTSSNSGCCGYNNNVAEQSALSGSSSIATMNNNHLLPEGQPLAGNKTPTSVEHRRQKPADFRRISSVSYNDEQLINDLCDMRPPVSADGQYEASNSSTGVVSNNNDKPIESPWRFEELSLECKHHNGYYYNQQHYHNHYTSQSSLENNQTNMIDLMNDSGIGTVYDFNGPNCAGTGDGSEFRSSSRCSRKRNSDVADYKPKQKPSYMSTDDYLSQVHNDSRALYADDDDDDGSMLYQRIKDEQKPVDVASRRAELEWTLNKLINFELKYTWLTGRDTLRRAIRKIGVPNEIRGKVWMILIDQMIGTKYDVSFFIYLSHSVYHKFMSVIIFNF